MKSHATQAACALLLAASTAGAQTHAPQWQTAGTAQYVCGGVSGEGMNAITAMRGDAAGELLFTSGPEGAYLADVAVTVRGATLKESLHFMSVGPLCLLRLPQGSYTVEATYRGKPLTQPLKVDSAPKQLKFNWPSS